LGERLDQAPQAVETLMAAPQRAPSAESIPRDCREARDHLHERQGLIESHLMQQSMGTGISWDHLALASRELGLNIGAALTLGDMNYLGTDIERVVDLMRVHGVPGEMLRIYLEAYYQTAKALLDERGQPIVSWFSRMFGGDHGW
jgi:hypothetical protein